jgi:predicted nucleic acid-binding protein
MINLKSLTPDEGQRALTLAQGLGVQLIPPNDAQTQLALSWTVRLGRTAAYDSFYLALAETLRCELWTADKRLRNAANQTWVRGVVDSAIQEKNGQGKKRANIPSNLANP